MKNKQRTIKFRVWDDFNIGKIHKFSYFTLDDALNWLRHGDVFGTSKSRVVQQFTGLLDRNGKEIYEGDILDSKSTGLNRMIVFKDGSFWQYAKTFQEWWNHLNSRDLKYQKIIGNIFENPSLLNS